MSLLFGLTLCLALVFAVFLLSKTTPDDVLQLYDAPFHLSIVRHIFETGNASPIGAGSVAGSSTSVYPDVVHALSALMLPFVGFDIQSSIWVIEIVFVGIILPLSTFELVKALLRRENLGTFTTIGTMILPVIMPFSVLYMLAYGPLYENAVAYAMLPALLTLLITVINNMKTGDLLLGRGIALCVAIFLTAGFCHPNTCFVLGIFLLPYIVINCPNRKLKIFAVGCAILVWVLLFFCPIFSRTVNCDDRVYQGIAYGEQLFGFLRLNYSAFSKNDFLLVGIFAALLALIVFISVWSNKRLEGGWYIFGLGFTLILSVLTLFPETFFARFMTGFWYMDSKRFVFVMSVMATPLIFILINKFTFGHKAASSVAIPALILLIFVQTSSYAMLFNEKHSNLDDDKGVHYTESDFEVFKEIKQITAESGVINSVEDCSIWAYSLCGVNVSAKANVANYLSETDRGLVEIAEHLSTLGDGSDYSKALKKQCQTSNYRYVLQIDDQAKSVVDINEKGNWSVRSLGKTSVIGEFTEGFTLVENWPSSLGNIKLYRIDI